MPGKKVHMTPRDHMQKVRKHFSQQYQTMSKRFGDNWSNCVSSKACDVKTESGKGKKSSMVPSNGSVMSQTWKWTMPELFEDNFSSLLDMKDSKIISLENDDSKIEISLNTAGYKPTELKVKVANGEISIEGKLKEKSEEYHTMVSRQFSKRYTLPAEAMTEVVSNLSQHGVTVAKEKGTEEVKENPKTKVEHNTSESCVPLTMRDSFFDDPIFKDTWLDIESSQKNFLEKSLKHFDKNMKSMESSTKQTSMLLNDWSMPKIHAQDSVSVLNSKDINLIHMVNDDSKMEISLDTTNYKPDELKVSAAQGVICVEGKHEEKSEAGQVMVARQFSKKYSLPAGARAEEMVYNLSQDGVLVISVPKMKAK